MGEAVATMSGDEPKYGDRTYWEGRYEDPANQEPFEWLQDYKSLSEEINKHFTKKNGKVLVLGTGRSNLAKDMVDDGFSEVCGVDWCDKLIDQLNSRSETPGLSYEHASVQDLGGSHPKFPEGSVDYVIDKALLDAVLCSANSTQNAYMYLKAVKSVLRSGGKAMVVTYGKQQKRQDHIERASLFKGNAQMTQIPKPTAQGVDPKSHNIDENHYVWVLQK